MSRGLAGENRSDRTRWRWSSTLEREEERGEVLAREEEERMAVPAEKGCGEETRKRQIAAFPMGPTKLNSGRNRGLVELQSFEMRGERKSD